METARKAGARGGTIIHARWAGSESVEEFYGITVQQEKEVIAIVSSAAKRKGHHGGNQQKPWHENRGARYGLFACD